MFDATFNGLMAFQQVGMIFAGLLCLLIGLAILGNALYWRLKAERVEGEIVGVREKPGLSGGKVYYPVYRCVFSDGLVHEATSDSASDRTAGKETGRIVPLMVFRDNPDNVRDAGSYLGGIVSLIFIAPGVLFLYQALTAFPFTIYTAMMTLAFIIFGAAKLKKIIIPKDQRLAPSVWKEMRREKRRQEMTALPVTRIEDITASPAYMEMLDKQSKSYKYTTPIVFLLSLGLMGGGIYLGNDLLLLERTGLRAPGAVIGLDWKYSGDSGSYYPIVSFTPAGQRRQTTFQDKTGSNPASYRRGDKVTVLYREKNPAKTAMIDRGYWNWLVPGLLAGFGALLLLAAFSMFKRLRRSEIR